MGQGTITDGGTDGLYTLSLDFGTGRRDGIKTRYEERIAELEAQLPGLIEKRDDADAEIIAARTNEDNAIRLYSEAIAVEAPPEITTPLIQNVTNARRRVLFAEGQKLALETPITRVRADIKALRLQIAALMEGSTSASLEAWCVDLTEDATGVVATIEVPGEPQQVLIAPGGRPPNAADGFLLARHVMTPAQAYFNAAILPGWQKFKPTYRIGVIDALAGDFADVTLVSATSSAQDLDVNRYTDLPGIPVEYMTCNAAAFSVGDRVVVQFDNGAWNTAKVIGFETNPKPCNWPLVYSRPFYLNHVFECLDPLILADIFEVSGTVMDCRFDRGPWQSMTHVQSITASGGRSFKVWAFTAPPSNDQPQVYIGYNFNLSTGYDPAEPSVDGLSIDPGSETFDVTTIMELRIMKGGEVKMNCAFRWYPGDVEQTRSDVLAQGGIRLKVPTLIEVSRLEGYDLFVKTGT